MGRYRITITSHLEQVYLSIAENLDMTVEQVLASVLQQYAENLTLQTAEPACPPEQMKLVGEHVKKIRELPD